MRRPLLTHRSPRLGSIVAEPAHRYVQRLFVQRLLRRRRPGCVEVVLHPAVDGRWALSELAAEAQRIFEQRFLGEDAVGDAERRGAACVDGFAGEAELAGDAAAYEFRQEVGPAMVATITVERAS